MKFLSSAVAFFAFAGAQSALAASWAFQDATVTVQGKGSGVGGGLKEVHAAGLA